MGKPLHDRDWAHHATHAIINELVERAQDLPTDEPKDYPSGDDPHTLLHAALVLMQWVKEREAAIDSGKAAFTTETRSPLLPQLP